MIESAGRDESYVGFGDERVTEGLPKHRCRVIPQQTPSEGFDLAWRFGARPEAPHVALWQHPIAQAHTPKQEFSSGSVDKLRIARMHEPVERRGPTLESGRLRLIGHEDRFHLSPESAKPWMTYRWKTMKTMRIGTTITDAAAI